MTRTRITKVFLMTVAGLALAGCTGVKRVPPPGIEPFLEADKSFFFSSFQMGVPVFHNGAAWIVESKHVGVLLTTVNYELKVSRIDLQNRSVLLSAPITNKSGNQLTCVAVANGTVWVGVGGNAGEVYKIDPATCAVVGEISLRHKDKGWFAPYGYPFIVAGREEVWVLADGLWRIDPETDEVEVVSMLGDVGYDFAIAQEDLWFTRVNSILRYDPRARRIIAEILLPEPWDFKDFWGFRHVTPPRRSLVATNEAVWVWLSKRIKGDFWHADTFTDAIGRLDPETNEIIAIIELDPDLRVNTIATTGGSVWVLAEQLRSARFFLLRINPSTHSIETTIPFGTWEGGLGGMTVGAGAVWVSNPYGLYRVPLKQTSN